MAESNTAILGNAVAAYSYTGRVIPRTGNRGYSRAAWGIYPCRNGHVGVIAGPDRRWPAMVELTSPFLRSSRRAAISLGRISISADISIISKESENIENLITPVDKWKKF